MQDKPGKFEFANQATMFLDEISAMGVPLQGRLLQVIQEGQFTRRAAVATYASTCAWWPRRTAIWNRRWPPDNSAGTCTRA